MSEKAATEVALRMGDTLQYRGPDGGSIWVDAQDGVALVHRRLAVLDLTPAGTQPMHSHSGRYVMVFNGEIYNHLELREWLQARDETVCWRGTSDSETILELIASIGIEESLEKARGMFALAIWDRKLRCIHLARDRLGEKPLYYGFQSSTLLFSSDLATLKEHPDFEKRISAQSVTDFLAYSYVPEPNSIYEGILKVPPGAIITLDTVQLKRGVCPPAKFFWSLDSVLRREDVARAQRSDQEHLERLENLLFAAVRYQSRSDVPLGAFLSGGVDSSLIAAVLQRESSVRVKTFSIGFDSRAYDESAHAEAVARHIGSDHRSLIIDAADAMKVIPSLSRIYSEPFADSSQIPTFLVSEFARRDVTVCLSGDGADELFGGYNRHMAGFEVWSRLRSLPSGLRSVIRKAITSVGKDKWDRIFNMGAKFLPEGTLPRYPGIKMYKIAAVMNAKSLGEFYTAAATTGMGIDRLTGLNPTSFESELPVANLAGADAVMAMDTKNYLPGDILVKVDRASMGNSLEVRAPFLDHFLVEEAWQLPNRLKTGTSSKKILREILYKYVPQKLIDRPKSGFGVPLGTWLKGGLRDWAEDLLFGDVSRRSDFIDPAIVAQLWKRHLDGSGYGETLLWNILMLRGWEREWHS